MVGVRTALIGKAVFVAAALAFGGSPAGAADWVVRPEWVKAHEDFLASTPLQGRGSATRDEAIAAAYVASEFEAYGLKPAPGMSGYTQVGRLVRPEVAGVLTVAGGTPLRSLKLLTGSGEVRGNVVLFDGTGSAAMPSGPIVVATNPQGNVQQLLAGALAKQVKLLIVPQTEAMERIRQMHGGQMMRAHLEGSAPRQTSGGVTLATLSASDIAALARSRGAEVTFSAPIVNEVDETTNAIGYLPGTDPNAGVLLVTAHLDHLGIVDGTLMPGANDDASGTTAVLELAHALAAGPPMRRGILFVCYGSEEFGGLGSRYFGEHPPIPLTSIVANLELEMIGAQDPKLPAGYLMMTGFDRSNFGEILRSKGALVTGDPYPQEDFFRRSDNYSLALKGIVAHTVSGWAVVPTYHQPTDTIANLNIPFMTRAIQSLIEPLRFIADGNETPHWLPGGRPEER
jgi:hypothetical protein